MGMWDFLKDDSPYSTMRLVTFLVTVTFIPPFVVVWTYISLHTGVVADIPSGVTTLFGYLFGFKAVQKFAEVLPEFMRRRQTKKETSETDGEPTDDQEVKGTK